MGGQHVVDLVGQIHRSRPFYDLSPVYQVQEGADIGNMDPYLVLLFRDALD